MTVAALVDMEKCPGRCGALVRPGAGYCTRCEGMAYEFEQKRMREIERNRRYGVPPVCEASDFPAILVGVPVRERLIIAGLSICGLGVTLGVGTLLWLGARAAVGMLLKVSATS